MSNAIKLGRIGAVEVRLHPSWLIALGLVSWSLAEGYFPEQYPGWGEISYWLVGLAGALLLFFSVLLHELSHSFVALGRGLAVHSITLFVFGGVSSLEREADRPRDELLIAIVGPLTSLALAGFLRLLGILLQGWLPVLGLAVLEYLSTVNLLLGLFNLIPGFPLDGGRVFRATAWAMTKSLRRATRLAARSGQAVGFGFVAVGIIQLISGNLIGGLWIAFIGWFLNNAAEASVVQLALQERFQGLKVSEVMDPEPATVAPDLTIVELVDHHILRHDARAFLVREGEQLLGLITLSDVRRVPREAWTSQLVRQAMMPLERLHVISPGESVEQALRLVAANDLNQLPVVADGHVVGLLTRAGLLRQLQIREELELTAGRRQSPTDSPSL